MRRRWLPWLVLLLGLIAVIWTRRRDLIALVDTVPRVASVPRLTGGSTGHGENAGLPSMVPSDQGSCPESHPVKANPSSRIYHLPHHRMYQRLTNAVCYIDEQTAEAEGYRASKQ